MKLLQELLAKLKEIEILRKKTGNPDDGPDKFLDEKSRLETDGPVIRVDGAPVFLFQFKDQLNTLSSSVDSRFNEVNENISKLNSTIDFDETRIDDLEENDQKHTESISNIEDNIDTLRSVLR